MSVMSQVYRVEMFQSGAVVHRKLEVHKSGQYVIGQLPISLEDGSIRLSSQDVEIKGHDIRLDVMNVPKEFSSEELTTQKKIENRLEELQFILQERSQEYEYWNNYKIPAQPIDRDGVPVASDATLLIDVLEMQQERVDVLKQEIVALEEEIKEQKIEKIILQLKKVEEKEKQRMESSGFGLRRENYILGTVLFGFNHIRAEVDYGSYFPQQSNNKPNSYICR